MVHLTEQRLLEVAITTEPQLLDQAHDGGITDAGMPSQFGHGPQAAARIVVEQCADHLAFRRRWVQRRIGEAFSQIGHVCSSYGFV